ncbi:hypothetical protein JTB14_003488 [Gonioctena quinquepunctata]|nr:hypothetical protein JTB14_003488 [Gonioctena quinquepunctata]
MVEEEELTTAEGNEMLQTPQHRHKPLLEMEGTTTLRHTVDAVNEYKQEMEDKTGMKKKYNEENSKLLERIASAKEWKANAPEMNADAAEKTASANVIG